MKHPALAGVTLADLAAAYCRASIQPRIQATPTRGKVNVLEVRIELMRRGYSVNRWAIERGFNGVHAHLAIWGKRRGPLARRIISTLKSDLGIS